MKRLLICLTMLAIFSINTTTAQSRQSRESNNNPILEKLWIGTGLDGFGISNNSFAVGLSPIVGYKITPNWSAGVRIPIDYTYLKLFNNAGEGLVDNNLNYGAGIFTRYKIFRGVFAHTELNQLRISSPAISNGNYVLDPENTNKLLKNKFNRDELNVGLGYSNGGTIGYEISVLYNVREDINSAFNPFTIRAGLNYNF